MPVLGQHESALVTELSRQDRQSVNSSLNLPQPISCAAPSHGSLRGATHLVSLSGQHGNCGVVATDARHDSSPQGDLSKGNSSTSGQCTLMIRAIEGTPSPFSTNSM